LRELDERFRKLPAKDQERLSRPTPEAKLRVPIPEPKKVILLAGNYAAHIEEGGREKAAERKETFPYFFWKPPSTTLTDPGSPVRIEGVAQPRRLGSRIGCRHRQDVQPRERGRRAQVRRRLLGLQRYFGSQIHDQPRPEAAAQGQLLRL